jgi:anti-anti-sigma factor
VTGSAPLLTVGVVGPTVDGSVLLTPAGDIDLATVDHLRETALAALAEHGPKVLEIDLTGVSFMDLSGVTALLNIRTAALDVGTQVVLRHPRPIVHRILDLTDLLPLFDL